MADLQIRNIRKDYGSVRVIPDLSLDVADGEFVVLVGPSGCGKSTLLRMIAGLEDITGGDLVIGGTRANDIPPQKRNMAMVFQSYALFPHMSVRDNISFGPRIRGEDRATIDAGVARASDILNLSAYLDRNPGQLSGGQRQRVAMGRSIVRDPALFLFDEPLSNLDAKLRISMRTEIKALHQKLGSTIIYVTHDQIEAMTMADRIVVMNAGRIEQVGSPLELYDHPANRFVAGFLGSPAMSFLPAIAVAGGVAIEGDGTIPTPQSGVAEGTRVSLGIRPESFVRDPEGPITLMVSVLEPTGPETHVFGTIGNHEVRVVLRERLDVRPGDKLTLSVAPDRLHLFDPGNGARLGG